MSATSAPEGLSTRLPSRWWLKECAMHVSVVAAVLRHRPSNLSHYDKPTLYQRIFSAAPSIAKEESMGALPWMPKCRAVPSHG